MLLLLLLLLVVCGCCCCCCCCYCLYDPSPAKDKSWAHAELLCAFASLCTVQTHAEVEKAKLVPSQARPRSGLQRCKSSSASHRCRLAARPNQACRRPGFCRCCRSQGRRDSARNNRESTTAAPSSPPKPSAISCPLYHSPIWVSKPLTLPDFAAPTLLTSAFSPCPLMQP
jgi:hypothetical protein